MKTKKNEKAVAKQGVVDNSTVKEQAKDEIREIVEVKEPTNIKELWAMVDSRLKAIEDKLTVKIREGNGRGPLSTRSMTVDDAIKIMTGDFKDKSIKECARELGLSYGQVYSARNGYTFKEQYAAAKKPATNAKK